MERLTTKEVSMAIARLMPFIIRGVHLDFLVSRKITQTQFIVMVAIHAREECSLNILANNMQVSMPTMSGIIDRIFEAGYVDRKEDAKDRRQIVIKLTPKGKSLIIQFQSAVGERWQEVLKALSASELNAFYQVVLKLTQGLKENIR